MSDTATTSDAQLALLIRNALVTHFLNPPGQDYAFAIDPAQIRQAGLVQFAAVLDDGRVAINCPEGLPDDIAFAASELDPDLVTEARKVVQDEPAQKQTSQPTPDPDRLAKLEAKIDALCDRSPPIDKISDQLEGVAFALREALDIQSGGDDPVAALAPQLDTIREAIRDMSGSAVGPFDIIASQITATEQALGDRITALQDSAQDTDLGPVLAAIEAVQGKLESTPDPATLSRIETALAGLSETLPAELARTEAWLRESDAAIRPAIAELAARAPAADAAGLAALQQRVAAMAETLEALKPQGGLLDQKLVALAAEIAALRAEPAADMDPLQQELAAMRTVLDQIGAAMEGDDSAGQDDDPAAPIASALAEIDARTAAILATLTADAGPDAAQALADLNDRIAALSDDLHRLAGDLNTDDDAALDDRLRAISDQIAAMADVQAPAAEAPVTAPRTSGTDTGVGLNDEARLAVAEFMALQLKEQTTTH